MPRNDIRRELRELRNAVASREREHDLVGLDGVRKDALALSVASTGRAGRAAAHIADRAGEAIEALRRSGVETEVERAARAEQIDREQRQKVRDESGKLIRRLVSMVQLVLHDGAPNANGFGALLGFEIADGAVSVPADTVKLAEPWWWWIAGIYEESLAIFSTRGTAALQGRNREIEQALKSTAVELITAGAELRDLSTDVVPLLAYALFVGRVPITTDMASEEVTETVNDLLLSVAEEVASLPTKLRPAVVGVLRLAILLGEAQAYADGVGLNGLEPRDVTFSLHVPRPEAEQVADSMSG